ncbi:MAG: hypothetical protein FJY07_13715 [Bacteroidetes bacterium]|nr:hypothetical protein [Bacteroidota bacterium]
MKRILLILAATLIQGFLLFSQNEVDALRYSKTSFGGTARYMSMGGAFGALGADFSTLSSNPGGIGLYKKSEITFSPSVYFSKTVSDYQSSTSEEMKGNFNISNVGVVFVSQPEKSSTSVLKYLQFGLGLNRINNFNRRMVIEGENTENSMIDTYVEDANGIDYQDIEDDPDGFYAYDLNLAWWTYLIDTLPGYTNLYYGAIPSDETKMQRKEIHSWGSTNEFSLAFGANMGNRLYLGGALGFPNIRYFEKSKYFETDENNLVNDFSKMSISEELVTKGGGFNMKFGMIFHATDWLRIGGAIHSPTWYNKLSDEWLTRMTTSFDNGDNFSSESPVGYYDYNLETPWKALGGISFIIAKVALISGEYEYIDYSSARLRGVEYGFSSENSAISRIYSATQNIRTGAEYRFGSFALRGGYAMYGSPFHADLNDGQVTYYTGGVGYREKNFFMDLAYVRSVSNEDYYLYYDQKAANKLTSNNFLFTIGFRY